MNAQYEQSDADWIRSLADTFERRGTLGLGHCASPDGPSYQLYRWTPTRLRNIAKKLDAVENEKSNGTV